MTKIYIPNSLANGLTVPCDTFKGNINIGKLMNFPFTFTWKMSCTRSRHKLKGKYTSSIYQVNEEWSLECLFAEDKYPEILEIRRKTKEQDIVISGTFQLINDYSGSYLLLQRKFIQLIEAGCETILIDLQYPKNDCYNPYSYSITGTLKALTYFSLEKYIEGGQVQSFLNLSAEFESLLDPKTAYFSDVKLNCGTESFEVHKNILSARSPVFATMFTTEMKENIDNKVDISDISPNVLKTMLTYIYGGKIGKLDYEFAGELLFAADKYQMQDLKRLCKDYLKSCMSTENVLTTLGLGYLHDEELKVFTMNYICNTSKKLEDMEEKEEWKTLCKRSPDLAIDVLSRLVKSKERILNLKI